MSEEDTIMTLEGLLDEISEENEGRDPVNIGQVFDVAGERSFGPMLLVPGLIALSPLSGIPGIPTIVGLMVLLITSQILLRRSEIWLPQFVLKRSASRSRFDKALKLLRKVARFVDRLVKPRMVYFAEGPANYVVAALCLLLSIAAPLLEFLPFLITGVGAALTAFGLSLLSKDGLLALLALGFCIATAITAGVMAF